MLLITYYYNMHDLNFSFFSLTLPCFEIQDGSQTFHEENTDVTDYLLLQHAWLKLFIFFIVFNLPHPLLPLPQ